VAKRRGPNGEELPDGISWDGTKKRYRVHGRHGGKTLAEAKRKKREIEREAKGVRAYKLAPYIARWEARKERAGRRNVKKEARALELHVVPAFGRHHLTDVDASDILEHYWRLYDDGNGLSAKTIHNVHAALSSVFTVAKLEKLVDYNPCREIPGDEMPQVGENPWEKYEPDEVVILTTDERIRIDRRVLYALHFWFAAREGEACGFRFTDCSRLSKPLGTMTIDSQYQDEPLKGSRDDYVATRRFPVHSAAAALLAEWRLSGFESIFGRPPRDDDFIVPNPRDTKARKPNAVYKALIKDEKRVGIEHIKGRATHGFRKCWISMAAAAGVDRECRRMLTHGGRKRDVMEVYERWPWETLCDAVQCVQLPNMAQVIELGGRRA
jgi:hypothetical protein